MFRSAFIHKQPVWNGLLAQSSQEPLPSLHGNSRRKPEASSDLGVREAFETVIDQNPLFRRVEMGETRHERPETFIMRKPRADGRGLSFDILELEGTRALTACFLKHSLVPAPSQAFEEHVGRDLEEPGSKDQTFRVIVSKATECTNPDFLNDVRGFEDCSETRRYAQIRPGHDGWRDAFIERAEPGVVALLSALNERSGRRVASGSSFAIGGCRRNHNRAPRVETLDLSLSRSVGLMRRIPRVFSGGLAGCLLVRFPRKDNTCPALRNTHLAKSRRITLKTVTERRAVIQARATVWTESHTKIP